MRGNWIGAVTFMLLLPIGIGGLPRQPGIQAQEKPRCMLDNTRFSYRSELYEFDIYQFLQQHSPALATYEGPLFTYQKNAAEMISLVAHYYGVNPRVLLTLMEMQSQLLSDPPLGEMDNRVLGFFPHPDEMKCEPEGGLQPGSGLSLFSQLILLARRLNEGYFAWIDAAEGAVPYPALTFTDGSQMRLAPEAQAATFAVLNALAEVQDPKQLAALIGSDGTDNEFRRTFMTLFDEDPCNPVVSVHAGPYPSSIRFPWPGGTTWYFTDNHGSPYEALDFAPGGASGCLSSKCINNWIAAADSGEVVSVSDLFIKIDHGNGWSTGYFHVPDQDKTGLGDTERGTAIGHPGCCGANGCTACMCTSCNPPTGRCNTTSCQVGCEWCLANWGCCANGTHLHFMLYKDGALEPWRDKTISGWEVQDDGCFHKAGQDPKCEGSGLTSNNYSDTTPPTKPANLHHTCGVWYEPGGTRYTKSQKPCFAWDQSSDDSGIRGYYAAIGDTTPDGEGTNDEWRGVTDWNVPSNIADGPRVFAVTAEDDSPARNRSYSSPYYFTVDTTPPSNPTSIHAGCTDQNNLWQNVCYDPVFTWSVADDHGGSGVKNYHYYWGTSESGVPNTYTTDASFDPGPISPPDGCETYFLNMATRDNLNQESVSGPAFVLRYDGSSPTAGIIIDGGANTANQVTVRLDISATDGCSGATDMRLSNNSIHWTEWLPYEETMLWYLPALNRRWLSVYLQVRDKAGNESEVRQDTIYLELYPEKPHSENYRICADVIDAGGQAKGSPGYSMVGAIGQPWAGDGLSGVTYEGTDGFLGTVGGCPTTWVFTTSYTMTHSVMASGGGLKESANYRQGNTSGQVVAAGATPQASSNYQLSSGFWSNIDGSVPPVPPASTPVPPPPTPAPPAVPPAKPEDKHFGVRAGELGLDFTNQITTLLTFWAPAMNELQVSKTSDFITATWQSYVPTTTWYYTPDPELITGTHIYARFRDKAGIVYGEYETTVFYDAVPPVGSAEVLSVSNGIATLGLEASDDNSGVYDVRLDPDSSFPDAEWGFYTDTLTTTWPANGIVYVQYRDRAGNLSAVASTREQYEIYLPLLLKQ